MSRCRHLVGHGWPPANLQASCWCLQPTAFDLLIQPPCPLTLLARSQGSPRAGPAAGGPASAQPGGAAHVSGAVHTAAGRHDWHCVSHVLRHSACLAILPARQCVLCLGSSVPFTHPAPIPPAMCRFQLSPQAAELIGSTDFEGLGEELQACAELLQDDDWQHDGEQWRSFNQATHQMGCWGGVAGHLAQTAAAWRSASLAVRSRWSFAQPTPIRSFPRLALPQRP